MQTPLDDGIYDGHPAYDLGWHYRRERMLAAFELRLRGSTYREIARLMSLAPSSAREMVLRGRGYMVFLSWRGELGVAGAIRRAWVGADRGA